ncbi:threonine/serine dehydratase [Rugosimonospora acidiphila]|uniref:Threonine/serine dehydratase n=1 Tax=Rugosimonospora acidiphila TaxID=556531 RepID=A0ABP9RMP8_9ACTN
MIGLADVEAATRRIDGRVRRTPVAPVGGADLGLAGPAWLKLEHLQHTGSFKARGAFNRVLAAAETGGLGAGVVTASGGNAGLAVAYAAGTLGVPAEVYVPLTAPAHKVTKLKALGAEVRQVGDEYAEANEAALARAAQTGALFCHAYDQPEICAGQGTVALEMLDQIDGLDTVILAVGGGGLLAGVAAALAGRARVVGVEPETIPTLHAALRAGHPVDVDVSGVAADSLGARRVGEIAYRVAVDTEVRSVLVADGDIVEARRLMWERFRLVVEHAAAAAVAAAVTGAYRPEPGERVGILLCGANTDPTDLAH